MVKDVPPDCTVVGVPGHVVRIDGKRLSQPCEPMPAEVANRLKAEAEEREDHQHRQDLPDPLSDAIVELAAQIRDLSNRLDAYENPTSSKEEH